MRVLLRGDFTPYTPAGEMGLGLARALFRLGAAVFLDPSRVAPPIPEIVSKMLTQVPLSRYDIEMSLFPVGRAVPATGSAKLSVGWALPDAALEGFYAPEVHALTSYDFLAAHDSFTADQILPIKPHAVKMTGYFPDEFPAMTRDYFRAPKFHYCVVGSTLEYHKPAVDAFRNIQSVNPDFAENAVLSLKTDVSNPHLKSHYLSVPNVRVYDDPKWDLSVLKTFYASNHVMISPVGFEDVNHRVLEFLSTGAPVIAPAVGQAKQWLTTSMSYAVDCESVIVDGSMLVLLNTHSLQHEMLMAYVDRSMTLRKGQLSADILPQMASWDHVLDGLFRSIVSKSSDSGWVLPKAQQLQPMEEPWARLL